MKKYHFLFIASSLLVSCFSYGVDDSTPFLSDSIGGQCNLAYQAVKRLCVTKPTDTTKAAVCAGWVEMCKRQCIDAIDPTTGVKYIERPFCVDLQTRLYGAAPVVDPQLNACDQSIALLADEKADQTMVDACKKSCATDTTKLAKCVLPSFHAASADNNPQPVDPVADPAADTTAGDTTGGTTAPDTSADTTDNSSNYADPIVQQSPAQAANGFSMPGFSPPAMPNFQTGAVDLADYTGGPTGEGFSGASGGGVGPSLRNTPRDNQRVVLDPFHSSAAKSSGGSGGLSNGSGGGGAGASGSNNAMMMNNGMRPPIAGAAAAAAGRRGFAPSAPVTQAYFSGGGVAKAGNGATKPRVTASDKPVAGKKKPLYIKKSNGEALALSRLFGPPQVAVQAPGSNAHTAQQVGGGVGCANTVFCNMENHDFDQHFRIPASH